MDITLRQAVTVTITLTQLGYAVGAGSKPGVPASIPQSVSRHSRIASPAEPGARPPGTRRIASPADDLQADELQDVHGNDISPAVATYKLDATGLLYEEHSPQIEVPRLAEPTS